jgi:hypothetical protein
MAFMLKRISFVRLRTVNEKGEKKRKILETVTNLNVSLLQRKSKNVFRFHCVTGREEDDDDDDHAGFQFWGHHCSTYNRQNASLRA